MMLARYRILIPLSLVFIIWMAAPFFPFTLSQPGYRVPPRPAPLYPRAETGGNYMFNFYLPPTGSGSPWWPSWSPDGLWIAFSLHGSLWKIGVGETEASEILFSDEYLSSPEWSPDGRWLAYTSDNGSSINLNLLNFESGQINPLTSGDHLNLDPAWSPDGSRLAFVSTRPNGYFNIFVMELENGQPGELIQLTRDHSYGKSRLYFGEYDLHIQPTWSADGKEIIFLTNRGIPLGSGALWRMPAKEYGIDQARMIHKEETLYRTRPHWSPDGARLLYSSHLGGQFNNLFVLPPEGGEPYKMTFGEWDHFHPRWSPDGKRIVYLSNQSGLPQLKLLQTFGGKIEPVRIESLSWKREMGRLAVRVVNEEGNQIPARIYLTAADDKAYSPRNTYHRLGRLNRHFFHSDGNFEIDLPPGEALVEAMHGFEHHPASQVVKVQADETRSVTLVLHRMNDMKTKGWFSGSNHVHMNYAGNLHNTPENLVFMAAAEDLNVIGELIANKDNRILDYQFFTGALHPLSDQQRLLFFNEEYRPPFYGHISLINLTEHLISPFTTGYEGTAIDSLYPSNTDILRLARQQGALGAYVHPFRGDQDPLKHDLGGARGFPVDLALGTIDYHELMSIANWSGYGVWHHALNNGFRIPAVGGEDSISDLHRTAIVGQDRTYAFLDAPLSWNAWLAAIRQGQSFVTNGPLLEFEIEGAGPGSEINLPEGKNLRVQGRIESIVPLESAELVLNGSPRKIQAEVRAHPRGGVYIEFEDELHITESSWITLQVYGSRASHPIDDLFPQATTNPVWINVGTDTVRSAASAEYFIQWIDKLSAMAEANAAWRSQEEKRHVLSQFLEARRVFEQLKQEARSQ